MTQTIGNFFLAKEISARLPESQEVCSYPLNLASSRLKKWEILSIFCLSKSNMSAWNTCLDVNAPRATAEHWSNSFFYNMAPEKSNWVIIGIIKLLCLKCRPYLLVLCMAWGELGWRNNSSIFKSRIFSKLYKKEVHINRLKYFL